jgi:hypothetical protein
MNLLDEVTLCLQKLFVVLLSHSRSHFGNYMKYGANCLCLTPRIFSEHARPLSLDTPSLCCHTVQTPLSEIASLLSLVRNKLASVTAVEVLQNTVMGKSVGSIDSV